MSMEVVTKKGLIEWLEKVLPEDQPIGFSITPLEDIKYIYEMGKAFPIEKIITKSTEIMLRFSGDLEL